MAEVTSQTEGPFTVIVLSGHETEALQYLLERVSLEGNNSDEWALKHAYSLLDALDVEVTV